jgi:hypothetical protein
MQVGNDRGSQASGMSDQHLNPRQLGPFREGHPHVAETVFFAKW